MHHRMRRTVQQDPKVLALTTGSYHRLADDSFLELKTTRAHLSEDATVIWGYSLADLPADQMKSEKVRHPGNCTSCLVGNGVSGGPQFSRARLTFGDLRHST